MSLLPFPIPHFDNVIQFILIRSFSLIMFQFKFNVVSGCRLNDSINLIFAFKFCHELKWMFLKFSCRKKCRFFFNFYFISKIVSSDIFLMKNISIYGAFKMQLRFYKQKINYRYRLDIKEGEEKSTKGRRWHKEIKNWT